MTSGETILYSFIVPVYERADELAELLQSFASQTPVDFGWEIVIVDDGSRADIGAVTKAYGTLPLVLIRQENSGPGAARNCGMQRARGAYFVFLDSDVLLPPDYLSDLHRAVTSRPRADMIGGSDASHRSFSPFQKAVDLVMTSYCTTGGIRGRKFRAGRFVPRSFNMVVRREVWERSGGFSNMHPGEDPEWVYRARRQGFVTDAAPELAVYHKRRIDGRSFVRQIYRFALTRMILMRRYPESFSPVFLAPVVWTLFLILALAKPGIFAVLMGLYLLCALAEFLVRSRSLRQSLTALGLIFVQQTVYAYGIIRGFWYLYVRQMAPEKAFPELFFAGKNKCGP